MPDERRCPLCGSEAKWDFKGGCMGGIECSKPGCELPCWLWDDWEKLQRERDDAQAEVERQRKAIQNITTEIGCPLCGSQALRQRSGRGERIAECARCGLDTAFWLRIDQRLQGQCGEAKAQIATLCDLVEQLKRERDEAKAQVELLEQTVQEIRDRYPCEGHIISICDEILEAEVEEM